MWLLQRFSQVNSYCKIVSMMKYGNQQDRRVWARLLYVWLVGLAGCSKIVNRGNVEEVEGKRSSLLAEKRSRLLKEQGESLEKAQRIVERMEQFYYTGSGLVDRRMLNESRYRLYKQGGVMRMSKWEVLHREKEAQRDIDRLKKIAYRKWLCNVPNVALKAANVLNIILSKDTTRREICEAYFREFYHPDKCFFSSASPLAKYRQEIGWAYTILLDYVERKDCVK